MDSVNDIVPNYGHELLKVLFHHIRYQVKQAVGSSGMMDKATKDFITNKVKKNDAYEEEPANKFIRICLK